GVEALRIAKVVGAAEYDLRRLGSELTSCLRCSGLDDDRPALDRTGNVQRPPHGKIRPLMVQHMHLLRIEINAGLDVADEGVVRPTVPQAGNNIEELARATVALPMLQVFFAPEVHRLARIGGGDDVPAGAPATDMFERGQF